jgi:hypothetical protein
MIIVRRDDLARKVVGGPEVMVKDAEVQALHQMAPTVRVSAMRVALAEESRDLGCGDVDKGVPNCASASAGAREHRGRYWRERAHATRHETRCGAE